MTRRSTLWVTLCIVIGLAVGLAAGYVLWRRPLARAQKSLEVLSQVAGPGTTPLRDASPAAVIDLSAAEGTSMVQGQWRYTETTNQQSSAHGVAAIPDRGWVPVPAGELGYRRAGSDRFAWYRFDATIPERVGEFEARASAVVFELAVHGYAEIWVNGTLSPVLGRNGGSLVSGFSGRNRVLLTRDARPGQRFEITVLGIDRVLGEPAPNTFAIRSATLDFIPWRAEGRPTTHHIVRLDPEVDRIFSPGIRLEKIAGGLRSGEGPVWVPTGYLLFSDFRANLIYRWTADDGLTVFRTKSGYAGVDIAAYALPGSNGLAVDREGRLTIAEHGRRRVVRLERTGDVTVLADAYEGRRLNSPNDLVYKSDGTLYFTDPPFGLPRHRAERRELPYSGVFRWMEGRLQLLTADLSGPNGLAFSPDERYLYVADVGQGTIVRYAVRDDGTLTDGQNFYKVGGDGMKIDRRGNLYVAAGDGVRLISPAGRALGTLKTPERPTNLAWGDDDYRTLYIVGGTAVYRIRTEVAGSGPWRDR